ncbi:hypothetical protein [Saccharicrinis sp. GN24d3]|uniref:hypothetical protein n=1 Tax=Saccharicrinis sp. GN24d3 TaxID=3458416 RepID=UPI004035CF0F
MASWPLIKVYRNSSLNEYSATNLSFEDGLVEVDASIKESNFMRAYHNYKKGDFTRWREEMEKVIA